MNQVSAPDLLKALERLLDRYVGLANSGDCGNWDPETEDEVIAARAALTPSSVDAVPVAGVYLRRDGAVILCQRGYEMDTRLYAHPVPAKNDGGAA